MKGKILAAAISAVMLISLISVFQVTPVSANPDPATFTILFTNDSHARMEPLPRIATLVEEIRAEEVDLLLLDAGDAFLGDPVANFFDGWPIVEIMNLLGYDAMELGNHEFDHGQDVLCDLAGEADFPLLAANLRWKDDPNQIPSWAKGYVIEEVGGVKVAIFGLITEDLPVVAHPLHVENLLVLDPIGVAENYVLLLENADIIIALTHLGLDIDMKLATEVEGIDVIVGGHSHDTLLEPVVVENTIIVQAGEYYEYLGRLDLEIEGDSIVGFSYELIPTEGVAEDPETKAIVDNYKGQLAGIFKEVVGVTSVPLDGSRKPFGVRNRETNLGDLVADSILWYLEPWDVDIAVQNGGGIRWHRWFPAGKITLGDVYELLPFPNVMVASTLPGENIWKALERSVGEFPNEFGGFLHIAGIRFSFDPSKPAGNRVENVWVDGEPLDNAKTYRVGMNDFTAAGGDGYVELMGGDNFAYTGVLYIEPFRAYLENLGTVDPTCDGRITALGYLDAGEVRTHKTIQEAIDAAHPGDTVLVDPGTYYETLEVDVENLTLRSTDGAETTIIEGYEGATKPTLTISAEGVTVFGFTIRSGRDIEPAWTIVVEGDSALLTDLHVIKDPLAKGRNAGAAILVGTPVNGMGVGGVNGFTFTDSTVDSAWNGIYAPRNPGSSNIVVRNVDFTYPGEYAILLMMSTNSTIKGNTFTCTADKYGVTVTRGSDNIEIVNNQFVGSGSQADSHVGILLQAYAEGTMGVVDILRNDISGFNIGILVEDVVTSGISINYNNIVGNLMGVKHTSTFTVDATLNWWGDPSGPSGVGPGSGDAVSENVNYTPWFATENPSEDVKNVELVRAGETTAWSETIQSAIDAASPGDTVLVYPGTYEEDITINKNLTLLGARHGEDARGRTGEESEIVGSIRVTSDVIIDGFKVTGTELGKMKGVCLRAESSSVTVKNNIIVAVDGSGYDYSGIVDFDSITNALVEQNYFIGVYDSPRRPNVIRLGVSGAGNVTVQNNEMHDVGGGGGIGIMSNNASAVINIMGNEIDNTGDGIWIWNVGSSVFDTISIVNNNIHNCGDGNYGVKVVGTVEGDVDIQFNNIYDNPYGVYNGVSGFIVDATHNWWGHPSGPRRDKDNPKGKGPGRGDRVSENVRYQPWLTRPFQIVLEKHVGHYGFEGPYLDEGWNTLSVPIYLDNNAWEEIAACLDENIAYRFDASTQAWELMTTGSKLDPLDATYIRMNSGGIVPLAVSASITCPPEKELKRGWNLVGLAPRWEEENMPVDQAFVSVEQTPDGNRGYTIVVSPLLNRESWTYTIVQPEKPLMHKNEGYWVYMENPDNLAGFSSTPLPFLEPE